MTFKLLTAALALALGAGTGWTPLQPSPAAAQEAEAEAPQVVEMALGEADAPVEVIEYASYTCPHCGTFHENVLPRLKEEYIDTGKVRFVYREVYFDKYGMWASMIARCGGEERFFGITDLLYDAQSDWSRAGSDVAVANELRKIGRLAGLGEEQIEACLNDADKLRALVGWYQENATEHGIRSTPSFVIDGETYGNMSYADFSDLLDEKLGEE
jgi:protein-disulfide isomerase